MDPVSIAYALTPIGSLIFFLLKEVLNTAIAAQDVTVEKENFKTLARYLKEVHGVLMDFQRRNLADSPAMRAALENMKLNLLEAQKVLKSTEGHSRFLLLIKSRKLVKRAQNATRGIGEALQLLLVAASEVQMDIGENAFRLKEMMITAEFQASADQARVMNTLERGLQEHKTDQTFANDLLRQIAHAVGLSQDEGDLKSELQTFKREAEEIALRKEYQEKAFMDQVIAILDRAEAVSPPEDPILKYRKLIEKASCAEGQLPPFPAFICPLTEKVMEDPVILGGTETTYEKVAIIQHLAGQAEGSTTDPMSRKLLAKVELRPNNSLRSSIKEWDDLNTIIRIRQAKESLLCQETWKQEIALEELSGLCQMNAEYKYWIASEGILEAILHLWTTSNPEPKVRELCLSTVTKIVSGVDLHKERIVEAGGLPPVIMCLNKVVHQSSAVMLLKELSECKPACDMIPKVKGAILLLVTVYFENESNADICENVKFILERLSEDDENVEAMVMANWMDPLVKRLSTGPETTKAHLANFLAKKLRESDVNLDNKTLLAEGAVIHLVAMLKSSSFRLKMFSLEALSNLSSWRQMKGSISEAGAVPFVLQFLKDTKNMLEIRESAAAIIQNLCSEEGAKHIANVGDKKTSLCEVVRPLLKPEGLSSSILRLRTTRALLGLSEEKEVREIIQDEGGVQLLFLQVWGSNRDIRRSSLRILLKLAENEGAKDVFDELQRTNREGDFVQFMTEMDSDAQATVAGILAAFPFDRPEQRLSILGADVVPALAKLIRSEAKEVQENAVGALRRFIDSDIETQKTAASLDVHPRLVELLRTGSPRTQARAAYALRNFSLSTPKLVTEPDVTGWMCLLRSRPQICRVHRGKCSVKGTFCLVEAGAVGPLVSLLESDDPDNETGETGEAALETLETLVVGDEIVQSGAMVLHEVHGIQPLFSLLSHKVHAEKAVHLLEYIFKVPMMKEVYRRSASLPLKELASPPNTTVLRARAARLLASIEMANVSFG